MANSDFNIETFAHDVCKHVLEKFQIIKGPDVTRKQNDYTNSDFLPCISRTVASFSLWLRDSFKIAFENKYKSSDFKDKEKIWNIFDDHLLRTFVLAGKNCSAKVCMSLALCTEYSQFARWKNLHGNFNKLVIMWADFFEKNLRVNFETEGGLFKLHSNLQTCHANKIDDFHKAFILKFCQHYGTRECTTELEKHARKYGFPLDVMFEDTMNLKNRFSSALLSENETRPSEEPQCNLPGREKPKPENRSETSDSEGSNTDTSEKIDSENSQNIGESSDSEISQKNLLGILPHEEMLRKIDPFFMENIPAPPKPRSASKSPERQPGSSDDPRSSPEQGEFQEKVENILSQLEYDVGTLKDLLFRHGLLSMNSGRRGSRRIRTRFRPNANLQILTESFQMRTTNQATDS